MLAALSDADRCGDERVAQCALYAADAAAAAVGIEPLKLSKCAIRAVEGATRAHPASDYVQETGRALLEKLTKAFAGGVEERLEDRLRTLAGFHAHAQDWQQVATADAVYYYNCAQRSTCWERPSEHLAFAQELDAVVSRQRLLQRVAYEREFGKRYARCLGQAGSETECVRGSLSLSRGRVCDGAYSYRTP